MYQHSQDLNNQLYNYATSLEKIILTFGKFCVNTRLGYERKIANLAQLAMNKGIDIEELTKDIKQEKKNDKLIEKYSDNNIFTSEKKKDKKEIEINNITDQIFCKDFYTNLFQYFNRKKESLNLNNFNPIYGNKFKNQVETNNINNNYDSKRTTIYIPMDTGKRSPKFSGKKRKSNKSK